MEQWTVRLQNQFIIIIIIIIITSDINTFLYNI